MLHLIAGPMFSGKSSRLIYYIRKYKTLDYSLCVVKPTIDDRYDAFNVCSHNQEKETCNLLATDQLASIVDLPEYKESKVVLIEEAQFFTGLVDTVKRILDQDKKMVYISGLNGDCNRNVFGEIHLLLPLCSSVEFLNALCMKCKDGTPAIYSKRNNTDSTQIIVAGNDMYESVCHNHYLS